MSVPSHNTKSETSSPSMKSSITTAAPEAPNDPEKQSITASSASSTLMATVTPLPAAKPSALMTIGAPVM